MPTTFDTVTKDVTDLAERVMREHHKPLSELGVTVTYLFAYADKDEEGQPKGPALKAAGGYPAAAKIKINSLSDRVEGKKDATCWLDGDDWPAWPPARKAAVLDHELQHLEATGETDDCGRPKLKLRRHDFQIGGFFAIVKRHQEAAVELELLKEAGAECRKLVQRSFWG